MTMLTTYYGVYWDLTRRRCVRTDASITIRTAMKRPWHLSVFGVAALVWNAAGALTIMTAQSGKLYELEPGERAYYAAQPVWFVILTDISLIAAVGASIAILMRRRAAVQLFASSFAA